MEVIFCELPKGNGGSVSSSIEVVVNPKGQDTQAPTIASFTATPNPVDYNGSITLQWSSNNVSTCTSNAFGNDSKSGNGSLGINNLISNQTYNLTCNGNGGSVSKSIVVQVTPQGQVIPPVVTTPAPIISFFTATPNPADFNGSTTLQWSSSNAKGCTSNAWSGSLGASGSKVISSLTIDQTYNLTCSGNSGSDQASVTVSVKPQSVMPAPTITAFTATPNPLDYNGSTTLQWSSTNATSCTSDAWNGSLGGSGSKFISGLTTDQIYNMTCTGTGGTANSSVSVTVKPQVIITPPPMISSFTATPNPVDNNGSTTLSWSSTNATGCASNAWNGSLGGSGSKVINGLTSDQTYNLTCTGTGGTANSSVSVTVRPPVVVTPAPTISSFTATPNPVDNNGSTTLSWSSTNATTCTSNAWSGNLGASGSKVLSSLTSDQTYNLTCTGTGGSTNSSVSVTVKPQVVTTSGAYKIGDKRPTGGIVFNVDVTGLHGLEAQSQDYTVGGHIGCPSGCTYPDGSSLHFYTWSEALTAAQTYGTGWHLPTKDELNLLYQQKSVVGGFTDFCYLSSTEYDTTNAIEVCFGNGSQSVQNKTTNVSLVRAVRAF